MEISSMYTIEWNSSNAHNHRSEDIVPNIGMALCEMLK